MSKECVIILAAILIGLALARFIIISPYGGIVALSSGIVIALTVLLRKMDYLIIGWFILTSLMWLIILRLFPAHYYPFVGRGIFWGLLACIIAAWAIDNIIEKRQFTRFDNVQLSAIIVVFILWGIMSLATSLDVLFSARKLLHIVVALVASYMFYDFFSQDVNNIRKVLATISLVILVLSIITIAVAIWSIIAAIPIYKEIQLWFLNPNMLGTLLFVCSPLLITSGFDFKPIRRLKPFFVCLVLLALFFSFHRTSWIAILVSIIYLLWRGRAKLLLATVIIMSLFAGGLTFPLWKTDVYQRISGEQFSGRREIWQAAWNTALDHPVLGTGLGNSPDSIAKYIETSWLKNQYCHSAYLQNAVEMGFAATAMLLAFYITFLYFCRKIERNLRSDYLSSVVRGTIATFLGLLVHSIFGEFGILTSFDASAFDVLFPYVMIALPFAAKRLEERQEELRAEV